MDCLHLKKIIEDYGRQANFPMQGIESLCLAAERLSDTALEALSVWEENYQAGAKLTLQMQEEFDKLIEKCIVNIVVEDD